MGMVALQLLSMPAFGAYMGASYSWQSRAAAALAGDDASAMALAETARTMAVTSCGWQMVPRKL